MVASKRSAIIAIGLIFHINTIVRADPDTTLLNIICNGDHFDREDDFYVEITSIGRIRRIWTIKMWLGGHADSAYPKMWMGG